MSIRAVPRANSKIVTPPAMTGGAKELTFRTFAQGDAGFHTGAIIGLLWVGTNSEVNEDLMAGATIDNLQKVIRDQ